MQFLFSQEILEKVSMIISSLQSELLTNISLIIPAQFQEKLSKRSKILFWLAKMNKMLLESSPNVFLQFLRSSQLMSNKFMMVSWFFSFD